MVPEDIIMKGDRIVMLNQYGKICFIESITAILVLRNASNVPVILYFGQECAVKLES